MFEVREDRDQSGRNVFVIRNGKKYYLHSDGAVYLHCAENWPTKGAAQKILDKFYPKPEHVWEHGDVFKSGDLSMVFINYDNNHRPASAICLDTPVAGPALGCMQHRMAEGKFLFNIKDIIKEKM